MRTFKEYIREAVEDNLDNEAQPIHRFRVKDIDIGERALGEDGLWDIFTKDKADNIGKILVMERDPTCRDWWLHDVRKEFDEEFDDEWYHESWLEPVLDEAVEDDLIITFLNTQ